MSKELIGHCAVDSGQILLVDPCYIEIDGPDKWNPDYDSNKGYGACCKVTESENGAGEVLVAGSGGSGVVTRTLWGDGSYPVYVERDSGNGICRVIIEFDNLPEDEDDE